MTAFLRNRLTVTVRILFPPHPSNMIGPDPELRRKKTPFMRRSGSATAIARASRCASTEKKVPEALFNARIFAPTWIALGGTKFRGDLRSSFQGGRDALDAAKGGSSSSTSCHGDGAGPASGGPLARELLKPALSSGKIRCIGARRSGVNRSHMGATAPCAEVQKIEVGEKSVARRTII